jgi:dTDP-glucose pyrophosphorylase
MNLFVPIGGRGERFSKEKYQNAKPFVMCQGIPIIQWLLNSFVLSLDTNSNPNPNNDDLLILIISQELEDKYHFEDMIRHEYTKINILFVFLPSQTSSVIETLLYAIKQISRERFAFPFVSMDCDQFFTQDDVIPLIRSYASKNAILYKKVKEESPNAMYSFIQLEENTAQVIAIKEKVKISANANIGVYIFQDLSTFEEYACRTLKNSSSTKELYISHVYNEMLSNGLVVYGIQYEHSICLGTPTKLKKFCRKGSNNSNSKKLRFCFDFESIVAPDGKRKRKTIDFIQFLKNQFNHTIIIRASSSSSSFVFKELDLPFDIACTTESEAEIEADFFIHKDDTEEDDDLEKKTGFYIF